MTPCLVEIERLLADKAHEPTLSIFANPTGVALAASVFIASRVAKIVAMWTPTCPQLQCACKLAKKIRYASESVLIHALLRMTCDSNSPLATLGLTTAASVLLIVVYKLLTYSNFVAEFNWLYYRLVCTITALNLTWIVWLLVIQIFKLHYVNSYAVTVVNTVAGVNLFVAVTAISAFCRPPKHVGQTDRSATPVVIELSKVHRVSVATI
jgi:hypothetical protein